MRPMPARFQLGFARRWRGFPACVAALLAGLLWLAPARVAAQQVAPSADQPSAEAYYHFMLAKRDQQLAEEDGRGDMAAQALSEYRLAMHADPGSAYLPVQLAGLLFGMGQTGDAIRLARSVVSEHPADGDARQMLGEIYLQLLGSDDEGRSAPMAKLALAQFQALSRLRPRDAGVELTLGRLYRATNDYPAAIGAFEQARRLAESGTADRGAAAAAAANLVMIYAEQGNLEAARRVFASAPAEQRSPPMLAALGAALQDAHEYAAAAREFEGAAALDPGDLGYRRSAAENWFLARDWKNARAAFAAVAQQDPRDVGALVRLAEMDRNAGRLAAAAGELRQASGYAPDSAEVAYDLTEVLAAQDQPAAAADVLAAWLRRASPNGGPDGGPNAGPGSGPGSGTGLGPGARPAGGGSEAGSTGALGALDAYQRGLMIERLGMLRRRAGQTDAAIAAFASMAALGERAGARGALEINETYRREHAYGRALAAAAASARRWPENNDLAVSYALLLADTGRRKPALAVLRSRLRAAGALAGSGAGAGGGAASVGPGAAGAAESAARAAGGVGEGAGGGKEALLLAIAEVNERARDWRGAARALDAAEPLAAGDAQRAQVAFLRGDLADRRKHYAEAEAQLRRALRLDPRNSLTLNYLGYLLADRGQDLPQALDYARRAVAEEGENGDFLDSLGWVEAKLGRWPQAVSHLRRAAALEPNDPVILGHFAEAEYQSGDMAGAAAAWTRALEAWKTSAVADYDGGAVKRDRKALARARKALKARARKGGQAD